MFKTLSKYTGLLILIFIAGSCEKLQTEQEKKLKNSMYSLALSFLDDKSKIVTDYQKSKLLNLKEKIIDGPVQVFSVGGQYEMKVFDLLSYKNSAFNEYSNTFYKIYFTSQDGKILDGMILTIRTNQTKQSVDADIEDIILKKSRTFTGSTTINYLNDRFSQSAVFDEGKLVKDQYITLNPPNTDGNTTPDVAQVSSDDCVSYYLVTTTYYSDGYVDVNWDFLFTLCGDCVPEGQPASTLTPDCDPNSGGGGGTPETESTTETIKIGVDEDYDAAAPRINYNYQSTILRTLQTREIISIIVLPTTVDNPLEFYVDSYARQTRRRLTLFAHANSWTPLTTTSALINWVCSVNGIWTYVNGDPSYSRVWLNTHSTVCL